MTPTVERLQNKRVASKPFPSGTPREDQQAIGGQNQRAGHKSADGVQVGHIELVGGPTSRGSVGLKAYAVLGDEQVFGQVAAPQPVQLVINMAFHEILMDHHRNVESEGMAAVYVSYTGVDIQTVSGPPKSIASTDQIADRNAVNAHSEVRGKSSHTAYGKGSAGADGIDVGHR